MLKLVKKLYDRDDLRKIPTTRNDHIAKNQFLILYHYLINGGNTLWSYQSPPTKNTQLDSSETTKLVFSSTNNICIES